MFKLSLMLSNLQILSSLFFLFLQFLYAPYLATLPLLFAFLPLIFLQLYYHHNQLLNIFFFTLKLFQRLHSSAYIKGLFHHYSILIFDELYLSFYCNLRQLYCTVLLKLFKHICTYHSPYLMQYF